ASGLGVVRGGLGRGTTNVSGAARGGLGRSGRRSHDRHLESLCRGTTSAGALESPRWLRLSAVGGDGDAAVAYVRGVAVGSSVRAGVLDRGGRADPDRADAGGDGRGGLRFRARVRPTEVVVCGPRARRGGADGAAV